MASFLSHPSDREAARLKPNFGRITIGWRATISHGAHLCAHDHTKSDFPLVRPQIAIATGACICADPFVGPGVTVDEGAILEAGGERVEGREAVDDCH
jgi:putative colanic acid biosynthesis acetyltransferase WcaF